MSIIIKELTKREEILYTGQIYIDCIRDDYSFKPNSYLNALNIEEENKGCIEFLETDKELNKIFAAFLDKQMVGYISTGKTKIDNTVYFGEITGFFMKKEYRNKGIGLKLLETATNFLKRKDFEKIVIYNYNCSKSNSYYRRLGGKLIHQEIQDVEGLKLKTDVFEFTIAELILVLENKILKYI